MVCREEMSGGDLGSTRFCDAVREVEKGKCVCVCVCLLALI